MTVPRLFDRALIVARRDRHAATAEAHAFLLERMADDLAERIGFVTRQFPTGLVIEAYHGTLGRRLRTLANVGAIRDAEPSARLRAACGPDAVAAGHDDLRGLAAGTLEAGTFDLIASAGSLHLVDDLPGALVQARLLLKPDGLLMAALLGGETLHELRTAWLIAEAELSGGASPRVAPFADVRALGGLLQRAGFALPVVDSDTVTVTYPTPLHLMREIKAMAASNMLVDRRRVPVTRRLLLRAAEVYAERYGQPDGRVPATFEIVTLTAWVPHESQPKPLRPGSATVRLVDVLGTRDVSLPRKDDGVG